MSGKDLSHKLEHNNISDQDKAVIALGRIASGKHEDGTPMTAQDCFTLAQFAISRLGKLPDAAWQYFERHNLGGAR